MDPLNAEEHGAKPDGQQANAGAEVNGPPVAREDNKFQQAIAAWRNVDLTSLISAADNTATDIVNHQRDALEQRKDLAQKTRDFRKLDDAGKLAEFKGLLKAYQNFIDVISNQSKAVQAAFFQVYSPLSEAPDPYPLLEASIDSLVTADETLPKLAGENERLQKSVADLNTQLEGTEQRLEQERTARQSLEDSRDDKIKEVESSWSAVIKEKQDNWEAKERSLEEKVENQERLLKELKASYEVSQRLGKGDDESSGHSGATVAELEIVHSELDRANMRLAEVESRNEQLRLELAQSASNTQREATAVEDDPTFQRLQTENTALVRRLESARYDKDAEKRKWEAETRTLERDVAALRSDRDSLREKAQKWSDYDSIKSELEVLKTIEFSTGDDDENAVDEALLSQASKEAGSKRESLEQLLLARNKKLSNELTVLRVSHNDLHKKLETLQEENSATNMELERSRNLAATLENDLLKVQQEAANAFDPSARSVAGTYTSRYPTSSARRDRGGRTSPTSSIISGFDPGHSASGTSLDALRAGEPVGGGSGILPMVTAQRDRFKKKNSELETELQKQYQTVSSLRSEIASLQKDNLSLYEKTRYVSTYNRSGQQFNGTASSSSAYAANPNPSSIHIAGPGMSSPASADIRYQSAYESHISPFARFRGRESARAMKRMSLPERIVFQITRMVLATRASRNLFAAYCLALHLLIFVMLYWMGSADVANSITNLSETVHVTGPGKVAGLGDTGGMDAAGQWHEEAPPGGG